MKLLIITQVVDINHPVLGFFHRWIIEFAKHVDHLHVIALQVGEHNLPENVTIHSLGKEEGVIRFEYVKRFYSYIWKYRNEYDQVFVHMNQVYVLLGGLLWKLFRKKVLLWYMHKSVTFPLRIAHMLVDGIVSGSKESFRIESKKLNIVGHGIDTELFSFVTKKEQTELHVLSIGRVSRIKNLEKVIDAVSGCVDCKLSIVGPSITKEDVEYEKRLREYAKISKAKVSFMGALTQKELPSIYQSVDVVVNTSNTGSIDKVMLEAMSTGTLVVSTNEAFKEMFSTFPYTAYIEKDDSFKVRDALAEIQRMSVDEMVSAGEFLRSKVVKNHSIKELIPKIISSYGK